MIYVVMPSSAIYNEWLRHSNNQVDDPNIMNVHDEYQLAGVGRLGDRFIFCNTDWVGGEAIMKMQSLKVVAQLAASRSGVLLEYWERTGQRATQSPRPGPGRDNRVVSVDASRRQVLPGTDRNRSRGRK